MQVASTRQTLRMARFPSSIQFTPRFGTTIFRPPSHLRHCTVTHVPTDAMKEAFIIESSALGYGGRPGTFREYLTVVKAPLKTSHEDAGLAFGAQFSANVLPVCLPDRSILAE
jgi:hypothetical protein